MTEWLTLEEGLKVSGLRIAPVRSGMPSPWSELCKALFRIKGIPIALISARDPVHGLSALKNATSQESLPVVFWEAERPVANWLEQLMLAERLAASPGLLPQASRDRAEVIGMLAELCAENGFGWHRRILLIERLLSGQGFGERERMIGRYLADKYGYARTSLTTSRQRCEDIVANFVSRIDANPTFLFGESLTALDIGWAAFASLI